MKRLVWFVFGVVVAALVVWKAKEIAAKATPQGVQDQVAKARRNAGTRVTRFFNDLNAASAEREAELREALGMTEEVDEPAAKRAAARD